MTGRAARGRWRFSAAVVAIPAFVVYLSVALVRYQWFGTGADLGIFTAALTPQAPGPLFTTWIKAPGEPIFVDHVHPIILLAVPLLALFPSPITLLVLQSATVAGAVAGIGLFAQWRVGVAVATALTIGVACAAGVQGAVAFDFHEVGLAAPLYVLVGVAYVSRNWVGFAWSSAALLLVKEDHFLLVAGAALLALSHRRWRVGAVLAALAVAWPVVTTRAVPALLRAEYVYDSLLPTSPSELGAALWHSWVWPGYLTWSLLLIVVANALTPLRSRLLLMLVPICAAWSLIDLWRYHLPLYHYQLPVVLIATCAAVEGWNRLAPDRDRLKRTTVMVLAVAQLAMGPFTWALTHLPPDRVGHQWAVGMIPDGASVAADPSMIAKLSIRTRVMPISRGGVVDSHGDPAPVCWLILDAQTTAYGGPGWVPATQTAAEAVGFRVVERRGSISVYQRC